MIVKSTSSAHLTARGGFCICLIILLLFIGSLKGDGACLTLACSALLIMLCCYIFGKINVSKLDVDVLLPHKCHADKAYEPLMVIKNKHPLLDSFHVGVDVIFPHATVLSSHAAWVPAKSISEAKVSLRIPMRTTELEHLYQLNSLFPLGLF